MKLVNSIKKFFGISSTEEDESKIINNEEVIINEKLKYQIIDIAPNTYLTCLGAKTCVNKPMSSNATIHDRLNYIKKVVNKGHESILEHSNIIFMIHMSKSLGLDKDFIELTSAMKYTNYSVKEDDKNLYILVGSSIRALKHIILQTSVNNKFVIAIRDVIYSSVEKEFLESLTKANYLDEDRCTFIPYPTKDINSKDVEKENVYDVDIVNGKVADLVYSTNIDSVYSSISKYGFTMADAIKVSAFTFMMHDISRSCANQITRHRNGISQESQRYVTHDYVQENDFVDPILMNWDIRYKDKLNVTNYNKIKEIDVFKPYRYLISSSVMKEDARAWLPMNVKTKLLVTFSGTYLAKFFELRLDKAAQLEIRLLATEMKDLLFKSTSKYDAFMILALMQTNDELNEDTYELVQNKEDIIREEDKIENNDISSIDDAKSYMDNYNSNYTPETKEEKKRREDNDDISESEVSSAYTYYALSRLSDSSRDDYDDYSHRSSYDGSCCSSHRSSCDSSHSSSYGSSNSSYGRSSSSSYDSSRGSYDDYSPSSYESSSSSSYSHDNNYND